MMVRTIYNRVERRKAKLLQIRRICLGSARAFLRHTKNKDPFMVDLIGEIQALKKSKNATILAHYYQEGEIQELADFTGDSLKLARAATTVRTETIVFCGVHFMAETAKMLNQNKRVLLPDLQAGCSLAESCPADKLARYQEMLRTNGRRFQP